MALTAAFGVVGLVFVVSPSLTLSFFDWMVYGGSSASPIPPDLMEGETRGYAGFIYQVLRRPGWHGGAPALDGAFSVDMGTDHG